jgi:hypothetical protein
MNPLIQLKITTLSLLVQLVFVCFAFSPQARAACDSPDPGCPGGNLAEGFLALGSLSGGLYNTGIGAFSLLSDSTGSLNTATGTGALLSNTANENTANGAGALLNNTTGLQNTASGAFALFRNTQNSFNTADGYKTLFSNTTGGENTAVGRAALLNNTSGSNNIGLGASAGFNLTTGDNNIDIGTAGEAGESNTIRIGASQDRTFIAGIRGVEPPVGVLLPVLIDLNGQLGTTVSSRRFKHEIKPMNNDSEAILALKPVTFYYKSNTTITPQFGLIAEEVAEVNPDLVVRDKNGEVYTVRYEAVNAMLLNEFLKEHRKVEQLKRHFESKLVELQKQIEALTVGLHKVSAQVELREHSPQTVLNNQ